MYAQSFSQMHPACSKFGCTVEQLKRKKNENNSRNKVKFAKAQTQIRKKSQYSNNGDPDEVAHFDPPPLSPHAVYPLVFKVSKVYKAFTILLFMQA